MLSPQDFVQELAFAKAAHIAIKLAKPSVVIGADTIVVLDDLKLNKPFYFMITNQQGVITFITLVHNPIAE